METSVLHDLIQTVSALEGNRFVPLVDGVGLARSPAPYDFEAYLYEPLVCLILQGAKETVVGDRTHRVGAGDCAVISHALPVVARVTEASPEAPYLALVARIDLTLLRSLHHELGDDVPDDAGGSAYLVHAADALTIEVFRRYVDLLHDPADARVLGASIRRELHYRLLRASSGSMLRALLHRGSHASNVARAIARLREKFRERMEMDALARSVGMSPSSFYRHFKDVTATTPLQYQKNLRLTEARRLLRGGGHSVATAAFAVGYESASQFSREFSRTFGAPPRSELA